ncbi:DUF3592 domain-containing protein [Maribacter sp. 2307ULW6-5]|uniref:DUF3592 domain-containing protein n=1 Tax=Maribacter sp. 2307ULW6-5 TaxID=3386275 RepID=UPI0039BD2B88
MNWTVFYLALFLIGGLLAYQAFAQFQKSRKLLRTGWRTTATVIGYESSQSSKGTTYRPIFEFTDRSLEKRQFVSKISSKPPAYEIGEEVPIVYTSRKSDGVKTVSFWGLYRWSVILLMVASPLLVLGCSYLLYVGH